MNYVEYFWKQTIKEGYKKSLYYALIFGFFCIFAAEINEKEEKMKADSITSPIRKQGFRASMTVKW